MEIQFVYQKKRSEFGRQCLFSDRGPEIIDSCPPDKSLLRQYILRDPVHRTSQGTPTYAEHFLNTTRADYVYGFMNHVEGGWPKDVNATDEEQTKRYRRKIEKDDAFNAIMMQLCKSMENCILQNNAINIYQQYFDGLEPTPMVEQSSARTVNVYQDQSTPTRPVNQISWSPDNQTKIAVSHCNMAFQGIGPDDTRHSYIWEVENPNKPLLTLKPPNSIVCLEYHQKDPHALVSGHLDGTISVWDTRKGSTAVDVSPLEVAFRDPVHKVLWINSKSGTEFFSAATDGQIKWWDIRKMSEPLEVWVVDPTKDTLSLANALGVCALEYEATIPTKFMVGTETGLMVSCNRKGKTLQEKMPFRYQGHLGPVLAINRNPFYVKNFLSVGDWTAKIWAEDCRESPIMWTSFHKALLTDGAWSPTRLSVFMTTRSDGCLDVWDILQQQKEASLNVKICDDSLRCLRTHENGKFVAIGNQRGTTYLVEFSDNLCQSNRNDKMLLSAMFERETKREKILEARNRELKLKLKAKEASRMQMEEDVEGEQKQEEDVAEGDFFKDAYVKAAEAEFLKLIEKDRKDTVVTEAQITENEMEEMFEALRGMEGVPTEEPPPQDET